MQRAERQTADRMKRALEAATITGNVRGCVEVWGRVHLRVRT